MKQDLIGKITLGVTFLAGGFSSLYSPPLMAALPSDPHAECTHDEGDESWFGEPFVRTLPDGVQVYAVYRYFCNGEVGWMKIYYVADVN